MTSRAVAFTTLLLALAAPAEAVALRACEPLPAPAGNVVAVATVTQLVDAVDGASPGDTILVADGSYALDGAYLRFDTPGVTLRSASGNREAVVLDGNYLTTEIVQVVASDVTVADLTLREAYDHPLHVMSAGRDHGRHADLQRAHHRPRAAGHQDQPGRGGLLRRRRRRSPARTSS